MSYEIFIRLSSITGESKDGKHRGEIDVLNWNWGVTTPPAADGAGPGKASGKAAPSNLNFTHRIDLASPSLIGACALGKQLKDGEITVETTGRDPKTILLVKLSNIIVTSVETCVDKLADGLTENVALSFAKIECVYNELDPEGVIRNTSKFSWDIENNTGG